MTHFKTADELTSWYKKYSAYTDEFSPEINAENDLQAARPLNGSLICHIVDLPSDQRIKALNWLQQRPFFAYAQRSLSYKEAGSSLDTVGGGLCRIFNSLPEGMVLTLGGYKNVKILQTGQPLCLVREGGIWALPQHLPSLEPHSMNGGTAESFKRFLAGLATDEDEDIPKKARETLQKASDSIDLTR